MRLAQADNPTNAPQRRAWDISRKISKNLINIRKMARETGLEPATSGVTGRRSNQLSYSRVINETRESWDLKG